MTFLVWRFAFSSYDQLVNDKTMNFMQDFSYSFGLRMFDCGKKLNFEDGLAQDILTFWDQDRELNHLGLGCLVVCAMVSFDLVELDGSLKADNALVYLMAHGADEPSAKTLMSIYTVCWENISGVHHCDVALKVADCFREAIWQITWTPDVKAFVTRKSLKDC